MVRIELWKVRSDSGRVIAQAFDEEEAEEYSDEGYTVEKYHHFETRGLQKVEVL